MPLPDLGPWEGTIKEPLGEFGHRGSLIGSAALDVLGGSQGVGGQLRRIVGGIGGAAAARLAGVELEQPSPVVDAHQLAAQPDLHPLSGRAQRGGHRVEGVLAGHVVVGMDLGGAPSGDLVGLAVPLGQGLTFLILEDLQRVAPGSAVDPPSGDITTPAGRFFPEVGQVPELPALEEALPHVLDAPLHMGLVLGVAHPAGVGDEPPVL